MKKTGKSIILMMLVIVLLAGCSVAAGIFGAPYLFDTPAWIIGTWSNGSEVWEFTFFKVIHTKFGITTDIGQTVADGGGSVTVFGETSTDTTYEFSWDSDTYLFTKQTDTTFTISGKTFTKNS